MGRGRYCNGLTWGGRLTHLRRCCLNRSPGLVGLLGCDLHRSRLCRRLNRLFSGLLDCLAQCFYKTAFTTSDELGSLS